jgi:hypothetical protein
MGKKLWKAAIVGSTLGLVVALMPGCSTQSTSSDNGASSAQLASDEVANMSTTSGTIMNSAGALSKTVASVDTSYINWTVHPFAWDSASQSFIRSASLTTSKGYERTRTDTITFLDASGNALRFPTRATVSFIRHHRQVVQDKGDITATLNFNVIDTINKGTDTTFVKNGVMTGTCDDQQISSGTITNVTRLLVNGAWQFPSTGTIATTMPRYTFTCQFIGNGQATVTIHNLVNNKTRVITITVDDR